MSRADEEFIKLARNILDNGCVSEGEHVRAKWEDGTPAHTKKIFGACTTYDLSEEFPAITLRPTAIKAATDEILWIYQRKSNNVKDLNSHIWDQWADETGSIGKAYGYQVGQLFQWTDGTMRDQMDVVLEQLKNDPFSRRILFNLYNFQDLTEMHLYPCAWSFNLCTTLDKDGNKVLNGTLTQRSNDVLVANNWNAVQYSILLMMLAQCSGMKPGKIMHCITDAHIYDRHIPIVEEMIKRPCYDAPVVTLNPEITDFYEFTTADVLVSEYEKNPQIRNIPVAE